MRVVSVTEDFNQEPGNAIITVDGVGQLLGESAPGAIQVAFKKPGNQDEFLGTTGWQPSECWFGVTQNSASNADAFTFALSPDLALEMESRSYELLLKARGKEHSTVFHWPEVREPATETDIVDNGSSEAAFGYIAEATPVDGPNGDQYQPADYNPDGAFDMDPYQPVNFGSEERFAKDPGKKTDEFEESIRPVEDARGVGESSEATVSPSNEPDNVKAESTDRGLESTDQSPEGAANKGALSEEPTVTQGLSADQKTSDTQAPVNSGEGNVSDANGAGTAPAVGNSGSASSALKWMVPLIIIFVLIAVILYLVSKGDEKTEQPDVDHSPQFADKVPLVDKPIPKPVIEPDAPKIVPKPKPVPKPVPEIKPTPPAPPSAPPVAADDRYRVTPGEPTRLSVLDNDRGASISLVSIRQKPSHGLVTIEHEKQVVYTWLSDSTGNDSFSYQIKDRHGKSATASVTVMAR